MKRPERQCKKDVNRNPSEGQSKTKKPMADNDATNEGKPRTLLHGQFYKTRICPYINRKSIDCKRGEQCYYAHSESELQRPVDLTKTKLCVRFQEVGRCSHYPCQFAHGPGELRSTNHCFKTQQCRKFNATGNCMNADYCRHAHGQEEADLVEKLRRENKLSPHIQNLHFVDFLTSLGLSLPESAKCKPPRDDRTNRLSGDRLKSHTVNMTRHRDPGHYFDGSGAMSSGMMMTPDVWATPEPIPPPLGFDSSNFSMNFDDASSPPPPPFFKAMQSLQETNLPIYPPHTDQHDIIMADHMFSSPPQHNPSRTTHNTNLLLRGQPQRKPKSSDPTNTDGDQDDFMGLLYGEDSGFDNCDDLSSQRGVHLLGSTPKFPQMPYLPDAGIQRVDTFQRYPSSGHLGKKMIHHMGSMGPEHHRPPFFHSTSGFFAPNMSFDGAIPGYHGMNPPMMHRLGTNENLWHQNMHGSHDFSDQQYAMEHSANSSGFDSNNSTNEIETPRGFYPQIFKNHSLRRSVSHQQRQRSTTPPQHFSQQDMWKRSCSGVDFNNRKNISMP